MLSQTSASIAANAAGIADAFRHARITDDNSDGWYGQLADRYAGWIGIVEQFVAAAEEMERFRHGQGTHASWGGTLPHLYLAWGAIGRDLWNHLLDRDAAFITRASLFHLMLFVDGDGEDE